MRGVRWFKSKCSFLMVAILFGKGIKVEYLNVDKCLGVSHLGQQKLKTRRSTKID